MELIAVFRPNERRHIRAFAPALHPSFHFRPGRRVSLSPKLQSEIDDCRTIVWILGFAAVLWCRL